MRTAEATGDADLITQMMYWRALHSYRMSDIEGQYRRLLEAHAHVKRTGSKWGGPILYWLGRAATQRGDFTVAGAFVEETIATMPYESKFFRGLALGLRGNSP